MKKQTQKKLAWPLFKLYKLINNQERKCGADGLLRDMGNLFSMAVSGLQMPTFCTSLKYR